MYKRPKYEETSIAINNSYEGETIEQKVERIITNNEPITDGAPIIYQERDEGVAPSYDIRTDRMDMAIDAMDVVAASKLAKREERLKEHYEKTGKGKKDEKTEGKMTEGQSTQGTSEGSTQGAEK